MVAAARREPEFVIVPAHDRQGSNAILCAPPAHVPLSFGNHSFAPHLAAARRAGIEPCIVELPGIGLDIDSPADLAAFLAIRRRRERAGCSMGSGFEHSEGVAGNSCYLWLSY